MGPHFVPAGGRIALHHLDDPWRRASPAVLHGLRTAAAVSLSLAIAFWLQLDNAYWAGTTAAIVCQPMLGSSLRKGFFRALGTLVGAIATVALFAAFPQDRVGFTLGLAGWCALCGFIGNRLRFFASYGAMLAGYTAALLAGDLVNSPDRTFDVTLARVSEVLLGIVVSTAVLSATQLGDSRRRLAAALRGLAMDALAALQAPGGKAAALLPRIAALDGLIDQVAGEGAHWRFRFGPLAAAQNGLFACVAAGEGPRQPGLPELSRATAEQLLAAADAFRQLRDALTGAATVLRVADWLDCPGLPTPAAAPPCHAPTDPWPALVSAARACITVTVMMVFWMATAWPNGLGAVVVAVIVVLLLSPYGELGGSAAIAFMIGALMTVLLATVVKFALLPQAPQAMWALAAALSLVLVPLAALSIVPRLAPIIGPAVIIFIPLVSPANQMSYDILQFANGALAVLGGCLAATVALRLIAPVPAATRTRRILEAARDESAALLQGRWRPSVGQWTERMRSRAAELPPSAGTPATTEILALFGQGMRVIRGAASWR